MRPKKHPVFLAKSIACGITTILILSCLIEADAWNFMESLFKPAILAGKAVTSCIDAWCPPDSTQMRLDFVQLSPDSGRTESIVAVLSIVYLWAILMTVWTLIASFTKKEEITQ